MTVFWNLVLSVALAVVIFGTVQLLRKGDILMATVTEIVASLDAVAAGVDGLEAAIAELKAKVAAGGVASQADLDAIAAKVAAIGADLVDTSDQG